MNNILKFYPSFMVFYIITPLLYCTKLFRFVIMLSEGNLWGAKGKLFWNTKRNIRHRIVYIWYTLLLVPNAHVSVCFLSWCCCRCQQTSVSIAKLREKSYSLNYSTYFNLKIIYPLLLMLNLFGMGPCC